MLYEDHIVAGLDRYQSHRALYNKHLNLQFIDSRVMNYVQNDLNDQETGDFKQKYINCKLMGP